MSQARLRDEQERAGLLDDEHPDIQGGGDEEDLAGAGYQYKDQPILETASKKDIILMIFINFLSFVCFAIVLPSLWPFLQSFNQPKSLVGWAVAVNSAGTFFASPLLGKWADKRGVKEAIFVSLLVMIGGNAFYSLSQDVWMLLVSRFIVGAAAANYAPASAYLSYATHPNDRTTVMIANSAASILGFILGPAMATGLTFIPSFELWRFKFNEVTYPGWASVVLAAFCLLFLPTFKNIKPRKVTKSLLDQELEIDLENENEAFEIGVEGGEDGGGGGGRNDGRGGSNDEYLEYYEDFEMYGHERTIHDYFPMKPRQTQTQKQKQSITTNTQNQNQLINTNFNNSSNNNNNNNNANVNNTQSHTQVHDHSQYHPRHHQHPTHNHNLMYNNNNSKNNNNYNENNNIYENPPQVHENEFHFDEDLMRMNESIHKQENEEGIYEGEGAVYKSEKFLSTTAVAETNPLAKASTKSLQSLKRLAEPGLPMIAVCLCLYNQFVFYTAFTVFETIGTPYTQHAYGWKVQKNGFLFAGIGGGCIVSLVLLQVFAMFLSDRWLLLICEVLMTGGFAILIEFPFSEDVELARFLGGVAAASVGFSSACAILMALFSKLLGDAEQGLMMGWLSATGSLARVIGPLFASYVLDYVGGSLVFLIVVALLVTSLIATILFFQRLKTPDEDKKKTLGKANNANINTDKSDNARTKQRRRGGVTYASVPSQESDEESSNDGSQKYQHSSVRFADQVEES